MTLTRQKCRTDPDLTCLSVAIVTYTSVVQEKMFGLEPSRDIPVMFFTYLWR